MSFREFVYKLFKDRNISCFKKMAFSSFGKRSFIKKPFYQLSGVQGIVIGNNVTILNNCRLAVYGSIERPSILIGDGCYIGFDFSVLASSDGKILIGKDVLIASNVLVTNEDHGINPELEVSYMNQDLTCKDVVIGDGCWIGEKACILPGVTIGRKSIIGAGAVVTKSVPDYSIAVGNPARVIKQYSFEKHCWEKL